METSQLELFSQEEMRSAGLATVDPLLREWSFSRRQVFEKCQRLYYYRYYGSNARTAKSDPDKETLGFLKAISNRHLRAGDILHVSIQCALKARKQGKPWSRDSLVALARKRYRRDLDFSISYGRGSDLPRGVSSPVLLMEFYYRMSDAERLCRETKERLVRAVGNFAEVPEYLPLCDGVGEGNARIEQAISLYEDGLRLRGKVDLAFEKANRVTLLDWKLGDQDSGDDSLQLSFYALWATREFRCRPDQIDLYKAFLGAGRLARFQCEASSIARSKGRIAQDGERMASMDAYGRAGVAGAFTPCGRERVCAECVFHGVCPRR